MITTEIQQHKEFTFIIKILPTKKDTNDERKIFDKLQ